nr:large proline-rich protein BAG6-like [Nomia melanderi]
MNFHQGLEFDPFLPCNSHHVRRLPPATSHATTSTSQRVRPSQASATESQPQAQTATTSATSTSNTNSINTTASSSQTSPFLRTLQQTLGHVIEGRPQTTFGTNSNIDALDLVRQMILFTGPNNDLATAAGRDRDLNIEDVILHFSLAELLEPLMSAYSQDPMNEGVFLLNLTKCVFQDITLLHLHHGQWKPFSRRRVPLMIFLENTFPDSSAEDLPEQIINRALSEIRPKLQSLFATAEVNNGENGLRIDICATIEALLQHNIRHIVQLLFNNDISDITFAQETFNILQNLKKQLLPVLQYSIQGGLSEFVSMLARFGAERVECPEPLIRSWAEEFFVSAYHNATQPPDSEILPLLIYKDVPRSEPSEVSSDSTQRPSQAQSKVEPTKTEAVEEKANLENSLPDNIEEIPETFPGHEALPSDWVPIIARDVVRSRGQLLTQGMTNGSVTTFSDAYLGILPTKRRKLIEQQKPRLLVSTTPNHSAISASLERLVRESVNRAGVEEVDGAAVAVANDPGVRRAFGQAIRDCLNPCRCETADFPDPLRFPNATKYFVNQDRVPK